MPDLNVRTLWRLVRHAVVFEIRLYRSLFRWITRRPHIPGPDHQKTIRTMWLII